MPNSAHEPERSAIALTFVQRHWRLLSVLGGLLVTYALLGFLLVPHLIQRYAGEYVRQQLHRELTLGKVQFNPFTFTLQIGNTLLAEQNGTPMVRFEHLLV